MEIMIYIVLPLLGSIFLFYAIFDSMRKIGTNREVTVWKKRVVVGTYTAISLFLGIYGNGILNLCMMLLIPVIGYFFYHDSKVYVFYDFLFVIAVYLTDFLVPLCLGLLRATGGISFLQAHSYYIMTILADRLTEFMVLKLLVFLIRKKNEKTISTGQLISTFLLPIASIILLFSLLTFIEIYPTEENIVLLTIDIAILLGINLYFTNIFDAISRSNRLQKELSLHQQTEELQKEYYENLEQKYQNTRKLVHDIRNHLQAMEHLYKEQQNEIGVRYTQDIHGILNQLGMKYYTSDQMLNIILNDKVQLMETKGIIPEIKIADVNLDFMREMDITTIFANLLDNAIEASEESEEKVIRLKVLMVHEFISITLENSSSRAPEKRGSSFLSHKENHEGLGLKNVERTITQYKGDIQYEWRKPYFITRIMLGF